MVFVGIFFRDNGIEMAGSAESVAILGTEFVKTRLVDVMQRG